MSIFSINYKNGQLTLREAPDPRQSSVTLLIRAKDGGQPALSTTIQCSVEVLDVNDHKPEFLGFSEDFVREIVVEESVAVGYELGRLFAVDADSGKNGEVHYKLMSQNDDILISNIFDLNENTGLLRTKVELDREKRDNYKFKVIIICY